MPKNNNASESKEYNETEWCEKTFENLKFSNSPSPVDDAAHRLDG